MRKNLLLILISTTLSVTLVACGDKFNTAPANNNARDNASNQSAQGITDTNELRNKIQVIESTVAGKSMSKRQVQLPDFVSLVKQVGNTVVNITAENPKQIMEVSNGANNELDPFAELFKYFAPQMQPQERGIPRMPQSQIKRAMGSGFIISADGYILTNAHVVKDAKKIIVKTTEKEEFEAKLIGVDSRTDIALIKVAVAGKSLPVVKIGDPSGLEVGEWVAAIGAPFGFDNSVTQGIVSAKGRSLPNDTYVPFIQTDVPINPGNSGGPLFNLDGEVVAMNSQIYSRSGGYMGLSFSIPIDIAINISNQLKQYGKATHGGLGVQVQPVTKQVAQSFGLTKASGALVSQVMPDSAAAAAGIKSGDIILKADGKDINEAPELPIIVGGAKPGYKMPLVIFRSGHELTLVVKLTDLNLTLANEDNSDNPNNGGVQSVKPDVLVLDKFGLAIKNLDAKAVSSGLHGVLVVNTQAIAAMAGIIPNDVILKVNDKDANNIAECKRLLNGKNSVALLILRGGQQMFVTLSVN
jgi:serine protease Do